MQLRLIKSLLPVLLICFALSSIVFATLGESKKELIVLQLNKITEEVMKKDAQSNSRLLKKIYYGERNRLGIIGIEGQLCPQSFFVDQDETLVILDNVNSRIVSVRGKSFIEKPLKLSEKYFVGDFIKYSDNSFFIKQASGTKIEDLVWTMSNWFEKGGCYKCKYE